MPPYPNHTIAIDILGGLPKSGKYNQILVIVCAYSRFTKAMPMSSGTAAEIMGCLNTFFEFYGEPSYIISDNAGSFLSMKFEEFLAEPLINIKHHLITPYNPRSNLAERLIRDILSLLRIVTRDNPLNWHTYLPQVNRAINYGFNLTLKERPATLFFGREPKPSMLNCDKAESLSYLSDNDINEKYLKIKYIRDLVQLELGKVHNKRDRQWETTGRLSTYELNDIVYLKRNFVGDKSYKLKFQYCGPFKVTEIMGNTVVLLNLSNGKERRASMRNIKIFKQHDLTPKDHPNIQKIYPIADPISVENMFSGTDGADPGPKKYNLRSTKVDNTII